MQIEILPPKKPAPSTKRFVPTPTTHADGALPASDRFLTVDEVTEITSLAQATIYREVAAGRFPASIRIAAKRVAWSEAEIVAWMRSRAEERAA